MNGIREDADSKTSLVRRHPPSVRHMPLIHMT